MSSGFISDVRLWRVVAVFPTRTVVRYYRSEASMQKAVDDFRLGREVWDYDEKLKRNGYKRDDSTKAQRITVEVSDAITFGKFKE